MKENKKVSVVITYYNTEKFAEASVESVRKQSYENLEIILVDDESTDGTKKVLQKQAEHDDRIRLIFREKNGGLSEARVMGIEQATGEWILIMDGDDLLASDAIKRFVEISEKEKDIDIVYGQRIFSETPENEEWGGRGSDVWIDKGCMIAKEIYSNSIVDTPLVCKLYRSEYLKTMDLRKYKTICPQIFFEDVLLTPMIIYNARKIAILPEYFWIHREVGTSISSSGRLWDFYYDQIESGNIVLGFLRKKRLNKVWKIFLGKYIKTILRIWCLLDYYDLPKKKKEDIQRRIIYYYDMYFLLYMRYGEGNIFEKLFFSGFLFSKNMWKILVQNVYYKRYKEMLERKRIKSGNI